MIGWISFGLALGLALLLIPLVRAASIRSGRVAKPRQDRWHQRATALFGGVGIFAAFLLSLVLSSLANGRLPTQAEIPWELLAGSFLVFALGFWDDLKQIAPATKLGGQILAAAVVVFMGYTTAFFTPRLENSIVAQAPNVLLTFIWLVGISNAINLLDNMDGLAGGISFIAAALLSFLFWRGGDLGLMTIAMALAGSLLGFLIFNFPPASIFMGDSGSLFLGFTLAALAIARQPQASNVFAVMGVPTLLFLLPILDTTLVTFTRILRGQSPAQGGRDHTSHRLIAFGLSERQAVLTLYGVALAAGLLAATLEAIQYWYSLVLVPILVISFALLTAYLGGLKVNVPTSTNTGRPITRIMLELTFKRRLLEVVLDFFLVGTAYYLAFLARYGFVLNEARLVFIFSTLPVAVVGAYLSFFVFGVYRGMWRYIGLDDLLRFLEAAVGAAVLGAVGVLLLFRPVDFSPVVFLLFGIFLFLGFAASRASFRTLDMVSTGRKARQGEARVLIYGAGDTGELTLRWILMNPQLDYQPVGFLDDDPFKIGRYIHGIEVLGGPADLQELLQRKQVDGVILAAPLVLNSPAGEQIRKTCEQENCWLRQLRLEFEEV